MKTSSTVLKLSCGLILLSCAFSQQNAGSIGYILPGAKGAKPTTVEGKLSVTLDVVNDFGARSGPVSVTLCNINAEAINAAVAAGIAAGNTTVLIPPGNFPTRTILVSSRGSNPNVSIKLTGPGTLQSCAAETLLQVQNQFGFRIENIQLDCNGTGTNGLLVTADSHGLVDIDDSITNLQIRGCTARGLTLDGTQNSVISNIGLYGNTIPLQLSNGAGSMKFERVEVQGAANTTKAIFMGNDPALPAFGLPGPVNSNTFERVIVECNVQNSCTTQPGLIDVYMTNYAFNNTFRDCIFMAGPIGGPEMFYIQGNANVFENSYISSYGSDMKVFVSTNDSGTNFLRGGSVLFTNGLGGKCTQPAITSGTLFIVDRVSTNPQNCMQFKDTSGRGISQVVNWFPVTNTGAYNPAVPPLGSQGSFFYDTALGAKWWDSNAYYDALHTAPGQCRFYNGAGSPNGSQVGKPCDIYRNTKGGVGTTLWIKETGNGTTSGWSAK